MKTGNMILLVSCVKAQFSFADEKLMRGLTKYNATIFDYKYNECRHDDDVRWVTLYYRWSIQKCEQGENRFWDIGCERTGITFRLRKKRVITHLKKPSEQEGHIEKKRGPGRDSPDDEHPMH
jgi:hypothetical protein